MGRFQLAHLWEHASVNWAPYGIPSQISDLRLFWAILCAATLPGRALLACSTLLAQALMKNGSVGRMFLRILLMFFWLIFSW